MAHDVHPHSVPSGSPRQWFVAAAIIEGDQGLLLVQNRRRNGLTDWSTPGGVVEEGESALAGLAREVNEETGIIVRDWSGPLYSVETAAPDMGWDLRVEVYRALDWHGKLTIDDPDGIVVDAEFVAHTACPARLLGNARWVHEPLCEWIETRWEEHRSYRYRLEGADRATMAVTRA